MSMMTVSNKQSRDIKNKANNIRLAEKWKLRQQPLILAADWSRNGSRCSNKTLNISPHWLLVPLCITAKYTNVNSFASWAAVSANNEKFKKLICEYDILCWKCKNYDIQKAKLNINDDDDDDDELLMQCTAMYMGRITILVPPLIRFDKIHNNVTCIGRFFL